MLLSSKRKYAPSVPTFGSNLKTLALDSLIRPSFILYLIITQAFFIYINVEI
jgi:hypothetical protein